MTKQQIIEDNMNLVYHIIHKNYPTYYQDDDIIQAGMLGLCKAADSFNEGKSTFSTYAGMCILNEIRSEFRKRKKHQGLLSLDYEVEDGEGSRVPLIDLCVGDEDVLFVDMSEFGNQLTPLERKIVRLRQAGLKTSEIGKQLGYSQSSISTKLRIIIKKWREING